MPLRHVLEDSQPLASEMQLRDYFASCAPYLPDELLGQALDDIEGLDRQAKLAFTAALFAKWAYEYAAAMLRQRAERDA
jgi:hypothetical protein